MNMGDYPRAIEFLGKAIEVIIILKVKNDHRSKFSNLNNWKEEA